MEDNTNIEKNQDAPIQNAKTQEESNYMQIEKGALERMLKHSRTKGRNQGFMISLVVFCVLLILYICISSVIPALKSSIFTRSIVTSTDSLVDREVADKLNNMYGLIQQKYIEDVDKAELQEALYHGLLEALGDKYSVYYSEDEYTLMMQDTDATFGGIGAYMNQDEETGLIEIYQLMEGSPAEKAGVLPGDILIYVDGEDITEQDLNLVVSKVRGEVGTKVTLGFQREGEDDIVYIQITRAILDLTTCAGIMLDDNVGYIDIAEFASATDDQFEETLNELLDEGMEYLIIDLRANGGGYLNTSINIADKLIKEGIIVSVKDKYGKGKDYEDKGDNDYLTVPCVVLVDENTASASEILTGALKDHKTATILGTTTFGKGIVQGIYELADGSGMKITEETYYTPNGTNIHQVGIEPDIEVELDLDKLKQEGVDTQLEAAISYLLTGSVE